MNRDELELLIKNGFLQANPDEALTAEELNNLVNQGFLEELPNHFFTFHNNLTWEVIYETLLYAERRLLHNIIAVHIEKHNSSNLDAVADILLYHFEKARNYQKCVLYGAKAGDRESILFSNDDALSFYKRAMTALDNIKPVQQADQSLLYEHIGDIHENVGNHRDALANYHLALDIWQNIEKVKSRKPRYVPWKLKPSTNEAYLMRKLAMSYEHNSEFDNAIKWLDKAEKILPTRPGRVAAQIAATRSATLYRKGDFEQAIKWGQQALKTAKRSARKEDEAYANNMIANSYLQLGLLNKAVRHLENAEKICVDIEDFPGITIVNNNLGDCYYHLGDLTTAVFHYKNALAADEKMHNRSGVTMGHFNLGNILVDTGELESASTHLEKVISEYKEGYCRRDLAAATYMVLSKSKRMLRQYSAAHDAILESLKILEMDDESRISNHAKLQYAEVLTDQNNASEAKEIATVVLNEAKEQKNTALELYAERVLGNSLSNLKVFDLALKHQENSMILSRKIGAEHEEALSIIEYARISIESCNAKREVKHQILRAIEILTKIGAKLDLEKAKKLAAQLT